MNRRVALGAAAAVALLVAFAIVLPTVDLLDTQFSAYGSADDDEAASVFVDGIRQQGYEVASVTLGTPAVEGLDLDRTAAFYVAVGPDRGYPSPEADAVEDFVEAGGVAIVLDDEGASDALLERFGVSKGADLLSTEGNPSVVESNVDGTLVNFWEPVELLVDEDADATVLATAGNRTAKDASGTGEIDAADPACDEGCPLVVRVDKGEGSLVVFGDATFATNQYAPSSGAVPAVLSLLAEPTEEGTAQRALVVVDESRHVAGVAELGLTVFRVVMTPLGYPGVALALGGIVAAGGVASAIRHEDVAWSPHDPAFDDPYLEEDEASLEARS